MIHRPGRLIWLFSTAIISYQNTSLCRSSQRSPAPSGLSQCTSWERLLLGSGKWRPCCSQTPHHWRLQETHQQCKNISPVNTSSDGLSQQTTTHAFTCSVSEFMSSSGSIHVFPYVNSPDSVNKFDVSTRVYHEIMLFSRDDMYQWNRTSSDPVWLVSNSIKTFDNRLNTFIYFWIHMKTSTGGAVPIMNQYVTCQLVQKWFLVCWDSSWRKWLDTPPDWLLFVK